MSTLGTHEPATPPTPLLWRAEQLLQINRTLERADAIQEPARQQLLRDAEQALTTGPFSVLDKPMLPPSGDKHDYYSVGPYWWPNPATADGLPYVRRDGEVNPEREAYDAGARSQMESAVITLALAWFFSRDARYADRGAQLLRIWFCDPPTRMNPHLAYGQAIPGICDGRGIGIIETHTFPTLLDAVALLATSDQWQAEDQHALQTWFRRYLDWLLTSKQGRDEAQEHNNHGTWYDVQVAAFALFVGDERTARRTLTQNTPARIMSQIARDGSQPRELARTRSLSYSVMNLIAFMDAATLGAHVGVDLWHYAADGPGIRTAVDCLVTDALEQPWQQPQITPASPALLLPLLYRAVNIYADARHLTHLQQLRAEHPADRVHLLYTAD